MNIAIFPSGEIRKFLYSQLFVIRKTECRRIIFLSPTRHGNEWKYLLMQLYPGKGPSPATREDWGPIWFLSLPYQLRAAPLKPLRLDSAWQELLNERQSLTSRAGSCHVTWCARSVAEGPYWSRVLGAFLDVYNQYANGPQHRFNINFQLGNPPGSHQGQYSTIQSAGLSKLQALMFLYYQDNLLTVYLVWACCKHSLGLWAPAREMDEALSFYQPVLVSGGFFFFPVISMALHLFFCCLP